MILGRNVEVGSLRTFKRALPVFLIALAMFLPLLLIHPSAIADAEKKFKLALPGYRYKFPADHYSHDEFKTEWWYYTGHLQSNEGKPFGFELTFFRSGVPIIDGVSTGAFQLKNVYMAHFALTDVAAKKFYHEEKMSRGGAGAAGASEKDYRVWLENWSVTRDPKTGRHILNARTKDCSIKLYLDEGKVPALHGNQGVSQKASCVGCASHYYSLTRMPADGELTVGETKYFVRGSGWMDHEFGSNQLAADQVGWDWFSIQLDDGTDMMLYLMRLRNGSYDPHSSGTFVAADGGVEHLQLKDYSIQPSQKWKSPHTGGQYPTRFHVTVPSKQLDIQIEALVQDQELASKDKSGISYWEGACRVSGKRAGANVRGQAYVEMTGYSEAFNRKI